MGMNDIHLTAEELATRWHVHLGTLANQRTSGSGCPYIKLGKRVLYRLKDVEDFEASRKMLATSVKAAP
jgi:hypothetical protein